MSKKIKRKASSVSFFMSKLYEKILKTKPSAFLTSVIVIAVAIFLFSGGLYNLAVRPLPSFYSREFGFLFLYPRLSEQFMADSLISAILYVLGVVGVIMMYQSTKYAYKPRQAYMMFLVGVGLLLLAYIYLEATIRIKMGR